MVKSLRTKTAFLILLTSLFVISAKAQNYFYAGCKFPIVELLLDLPNQKKDVNGQRIYNPYEETAGMCLDGGFGFKAVKNIYEETGINYLIANKNVEHDSKSGNTLTIKNYILSTQIRPLYKRSISMDNDAFLNVGCGFNYQKVNSNGYYHNYFIDDNNFESSALSNDKAQSKYFLNVQPYLGFDFKKNKKVGYRLGVNYNHQDYSVSEKKLKFNNDQKLNIPRINEEIFL
jgi:hypothetical protein